MEYGSDCSGLDAPYLALKHLYGKNIKPIFASDIDKHVLKMLHANHKAKNIYDNIKNRPNTYVDIYFAGFPCQTFSTAGSRAGFKDVRGTVFFDIYNYLLHVKPRVVVLENVKGLLTHDKGKTFKVIMDLLEDLDSYHIYYDVLSPHTHANWPQYRPRVFIVCIRKDIQVKDFVFPGETPLKVFISDIVNKNLRGNLDDLTPFESKNLRIHQQNYITKGIDLMKDYYVFDIGAIPEFGKPQYDISPTLKASRSNYFITKLHRKFTNDEIRQVQGLPEMNVVVSESQYRKQVGNSICVPVLIRLFKAIFASIEPKQKIKVEFKLKQY